MGAGCRASGRDISEPGSLDLASKLGQFPVSVQGGAQLRPEGRGLPKACSDIFLGNFSFDGSLLEVVLVSARNTSPKPSVSLAVRVSKKWGCDKGWKISSLAWFASHTVVSLHLFSRKWYHFIEWSECHSVVGFVFFTFY